MTLNDHLYTHTTDLQLNLYNKFLSFQGHTGIPGLWTQELDVGLWKLDSGRWTLDDGLWTLDPGLWTLDSGCWTQHARLWTLDSGH